MRAAPALSLLLRNDVAGALFALPLGVLAGAAFAAWISTRFGWPGAACVLAAGAGGLLGALAARLALRRTPLRLAWDGHGWTLAEGEAAARAGQVELAIDLDAWLLLRFRTAEGHGARWIALARPGLDDSWHALRCALRAPHPAASDDPAA